MSVVFQVVYGEESLRYAHVAFFASTELVRGQELTFDYSHSTGPRSRTDSSAPAAWTPASTTAPEGRRRQGTTQADAKGAPNCPGNAAPMPLEEARRDASGRTVQSELVYCLLSLISLWWSQLVRRHQPCTTVDDLSQQTFQGPPL